MHELVGMKVMHRVSKRKGKICEISDGKMKVVYSDSEGVFPFPSCLADTFILEDEKLQNKYMRQGNVASFEQFKSLYKNAVYSEIAYLKRSGGKKYRIIDGERIKTEKDTFIYLFETDSELHFPDATVIKLWFQEKSIQAYVIACEEFTITIQVSENIGEKVDAVEFTAEPWQLIYKGTR